ncbi:flagellar export protein FliJ [Bacillus carboniphilus]|uniref:Flagellar FliJ protein n=1 Tax=Bacillus carboniphilus TaxID=86663 RepID=A0ABY9JVX9_9BACI|nr:flagellar export protein FliJ [Bacillus carboniphilus]WLR43540.1 flagellar export protein FliJ [Bacillus carboniphilus]
MSHFRYQTLLRIKEQEQVRAKEEYQQSLEQFEQMAWKLYDSLQKKEMLLNHSMQKLDKGLPIQELKSQQQFLDNLEQTISHYQKLVSIYRTNMNQKHQKVTEKTIDVKKFQKMKENVENKKRLEMSLQEMKSLDELANLSFVRN